MDSQIARTGSHYTYVDPTLRQLRDINNFLISQKNLMTELQRKAGCKIDKLFQSSNMTKSDILKGKSQLFPKKIRWKLSHLKNKHWYLDSSVFNKEFTDIVQSYSRYLEQFRYFSATITPLIKEIEDLLLTKSERNNHKRYLKSLQESNEAGARRYRAELIQKCRTE